MSVQAVLAPRADTPVPRSFVRRYLPYLLIAPSAIMLLSLIAYPLLFALRSSF